MCVTCVKSPPCSAAGWRGHIGPVDMTTLEPVTVVLEVKVGPFYGPLAGWILVGWIHIGPVEPDHF